MKSNQLSSHNLLSQSGATSLNTTPSMDLGHGASLTLGGSLSVSDHTAFAFTIEEILEEKYYSYLTIESCSGCDRQYPELAPSDPGCEYHAFVLPTCPTCRKALGGPLLDFPSEEEMVLIGDAHNGEFPEYDDEEEYHCEEDQVDLDKEKWDNYWGDYNQCGIRISY